MKKIKSISLGFQHIMLIDEFNDLYGAGSNQYAELGLMDLLNYKELNKIPLPKEIKPIKVVCGINNTMILTEDNKIYAFGINQANQLGLYNEETDDYEEPCIKEPMLVPIPKYIKPIDIFLGKQVSFVLSEDKKLYSIGLNLDGELGIGNREIRITPKFQLVKLPNGINVSSVSCMYKHTLIIGTDGNLYGFGLNEYGQLGLGHKENVFIPTKINLPNGVKPTKISVGFSHSLVIGDNGNLYFAGKNDYRELGMEDDIRTNFEFFVLPHGVKPKLISSGSTFSIVLAENNVLYSWGANDYGQLGLGDLKKYKDPTPISLPKDIKPISLLNGSFSSMIINEDNTIYVWGDNMNGQLTMKNSIIVNPKKINLI